MLHTVRRHGRTDTLVLYWFRTPPYVKVGRAALDADAMRRLEAQYPDIAFDWNRILREPPQGLPEQEAARRKEQRDARDARRKKRRRAAAEDVNGAQAHGAPQGSAEDEETGPPRQASGGDRDAGEDEDSPDAPDVETAEGVVDDLSAPAAVLEQAPGGARRRRRRRRRRGNPSGGTPTGEPPPNGGV